MSESFRVAVIGAGPAGFYACEELLKSTDPEVEVHLYDRLPTPYGLVRYGVAPDHQKIKNVTAIFDKVADNPRFRYFGNVHVGTHFPVEELQRFYHALLFTTGAQADRRLGIPGEDLEGSHPATDFVAWYNGHPDYRNRKFDLSCERATVVGVGNVAIDVARILCSTPEELAQTDIAHYALEALTQSKIREVVILGRRGPMQAAFTNPELKELEELHGADFQVVPEEVALDEFSKAALAAEPDKAITKRLALLEGVAARNDRSKARLLTLRFLVSPTEVVGSGGKVTALKVVRNRLNEKLQAESTGVEEEISTGLVFRSVGYKGTALNGLPFDEKKGIIPNQAGRITDLHGNVVPGFYTAGWIKRGPSGVIGTNKPDAKESAQHILEDLRAGKLGTPSHHEVETHMTGKGLRHIGYHEWKALDQIERDRGQALGRPRLKLTSIEEMLTHLEPSRPAIV